MRFAACQAPLSKTQPRLGLCRVLSGRHSTSPGINCTLFLSLYPPRWIDKDNEFKMWQFPVLNLSLLPAFLRSFGYLCLQVLESNPPTARFQQASVCGPANSTIAVKLYVSSYSGLVTSLQLTPTAKAPGIGGYLLTNIACNNGSGPQPSWLTKHNDIV